MSHIQEWEGNNHNNKNNNKLYLSVRYFSYEANWGHYEMLQGVAKVRSDFLFFGLNFNGYEN